ncbi:MAG: retention module-containing protein, partial [Rhodocyclaceae bacterium]|nr:retention module-containing protein [Rhodocyclaceae bacterium]
MSQAIATVVAVIGKAYARSPEGVQRELKPGDVLLEGETVVTAPGGQVELALGTGDLLTVHPEQVMVMSADMIPGGGPSTDEGALADGSIERVIQALEAGRTLDGELEAPAAGVDGGGTGDGNDFVRLLRIAEGVDPLSVTFAGEAAATEPDQSGAATGDGVPLAVDDDVTTALGTTVIIDVLDNDRDPDGNPLTIVAVGGQPVSVGVPVDVDGGTVVLNEDGTLSFTPADGVEGPVSFTYTISDGSSLVSATVTVQVGDAPLDDQPLAVDDTGTTEAGQALTGNLASNDSPSLDGGNVWAIASGPANGTVVVNPDGTYTYTPADGFLGTDSFTYTLTDANGDVSTATVTISVVAAGTLPPDDGGNDDSPLAVDDVFSTPVDEAISGNLAANDTPSLDGGNVWAIDSLPANGTATVNPDGTYSYTPDAGFEGEDSFTYVVTDADGDTSIATVTIRVGAADDVPVAVDDSFQVSPDDTVTGNLAANDTPSADGGNVWAIDQLAGGGEVVVNPDGTFSYTPDEGFFGLDTFSYTITDADGDVSTAVVTIDVTVPEGAPLAVDDEFELNGAASVAGDLALNDELSPDGGDTWSLSTPPANGTATVNFDGTFTYTPNTGFTGTDTFTYVVSDVDGDSSFATVTITVNSVANLDPVARDDNVPVEEGTRVEGNVLDNDEDPEGSTLIVTRIQVDANGDTIPESYATGRPITIDGVGELTIDEDGIFVFDPAPGYTGPVPPVTYTIEDPDGGEDQAVLRLGPITPVNVDPVAEDDLVTVAINDVATGNVLDNDTDGDGDPLTVTGFAVDVDGDGAAELFGPGSLATIDGVGTLTIGSDGAFRFEPLTDYNGPVPVAIYTVDDGQGGSANASLILTMGDNQPPVATDDEQAVTEDEFVTGNVLDNDSDPDGNPLGVVGFEVDIDGDGVAESFAPGDTAAIDGIGRLVIEADGSYRFDPEPDYTGDVPEITYTVGDGLGGEDQAVLRLGPVSPVNDAPLAGDDVVTTNEDTAVAIPVLDNDTDVDGTLVAASVSIVGAPAHGAVAVNTATGVVTYTPDENYSGPDSFTYTVEDDQGQVSNVATVQITVNPANDAPVAVDDGPLSTDEDAPLTNINVLG